MKRNISVEQLSELSDAGKERLREWWKPIEGDWFCGNWPYEDPTLCTDCGEGMGSDIEQVIENKVGNNYLPLLSNGTMIEFLDEYDPSGFDMGIKNPDLCDNLWSACLEILEKDGE